MLPDQASLPVIGLAVAVINELLFAQVLHISSRPARGLQGPVTRAAAGAVEACLEGTADLGSSTVSALIKRRYSQGQPCLPWAESSSGSPGGIAG